MDNYYDVAFITVNFNTKNLLEKLLFFFDTADLPFSHSLVVVDNASSDGSMEMLEERAQKNVFAVRNSGNLGYGNAVNRGLSVVRSKYICVLNTDVILNSAALAALWDYMESDPSAGMCCPVICNPDGSIQGFFYKFNIVFLYSEFIKKLFGSLKKFIVSLSSRPIRVDGFAGAFFFLRSGLIKDGPLFDPDFFFYFEDTSLAHAMSRRNIKAVILPGHRIIHIGGQSGGAANLELFYYGKYLYMKKFFGLRHTRNVYHLDLLKARIKSFRYKLLSAICPIRRLKAKSSLYSALSRHLRKLEPVKDS